MHSEEFTFNAVFDYFTEKDITHKHGDTKFYLKFIDTENAADAQKREEAEEKMRVLDALVVSSQAQCKTLENLQLHSKSSPSVP